MEAGWRTCRPVSRRLAYRLATAWLVLAAGEVHGEGEDGGKRGASSAPSMAAAPMPVPESAPS
jgi:hypothetical protein